MTSPDITRRDVGEIVSDLRSRIEHVTVATSMTHTDSVTAPPTSRRRGRNRRSPAEQAARVAASKATLDALHQRLQDGVRGLTSSEDWMTWLTVAATFRTYSFNNQILIMLQRPDATLVKGYRAWQANGRYVRKGETAIKILAPITRKATEDDSETSTVVGYRTASVFALQQTAGDPLPTPPRPQQLTGDAPRGLWNHLAGMVHQRGFLLTRADCSPANGITDFTTKTVTVRPDLSTAQAVKTLAHELGHILLHQPQTGAQPRCRGLVEVEAESVAYLVTAAHGLDTGDYTFPYVAHWATHTGDDIIDTITATAGRVLTTAQALLPDINSTATDIAAPAEPLRSTLTSPAPSNHPQPTGVSDDEALAALQLAAEHWGSHAHHASDYLTSRGLSDVAAHPDQYRIGYAPDRWTDLVETLRSRGIRDETLLQTGLATRSRRGTLIDLFRGRLMFPILDNDHGHVVGAIGRDITGHGSAPKYINSPTTTWYHKSRLLYGYTEQRTELAQGFTPVLVEGPIDVLAVRRLQQPLVPIAPSGTALTPNHVQALADIATSPRIIVAFDADDAGRTAASRAYPLLKDNFAAVRYLPLPAGADPATAIAEHGDHDLFRPGTLKPLADLVTDQALGDDPTRDALTRIDATHRAAGQIAAMPAHEWTRQVNRVSAQLELSTTAIQQAIITQLADHYANLDRPLPRHNQRCGDSIADETRLQTPLPTRTWRR